MLSLILLLLACRPGCPYPHPPEGAEKVGCRMDRIEEPDGTARWRVYVTAQLAGGEKWQKLFAIRGGEERRKAFGDCDDWLNHVKENGDGRADRIR